MQAPDKAIPQEPLGRAQCVVVPEMKVGAFIFGAKYGKGFSPAAVTTSPTLTVIGFTAVMRGKLVCADSDFRAGPWVTVVCLSG